MRTTARNKKNIGIKRAVNAGFLRELIPTSKAVFLIPFLFKL